MHTISHRMRWTQLRYAVATALTGRHHYLSTGCLHDDHAYCRALEGRAGAKRPGECKACRARCLCPVCRH